MTRAFYAKGAAAARPLDASPAGGSEKGRGAASPSSRAPEPVRDLVLFLLAPLLLPGSVLAFAGTGPHTTPVALAWLGVLPALATLERMSGKATGPEGPKAGRRGYLATARWPHDVLLSVLAALQFVTVVLAARLVAGGGVSWGDAIAVVVLGGASTAALAVTVAHELLHGRSKASRLLGRMLSWTALYDHFAVAHVRDHHLRVAREDDAVTARFDETFWSYARRAVPGEFLSAWRVGALGSAARRSTGARGAPMSAAAGGGRAKEGQAPRSRWQVVADVVRNTAFQGLVAQAVLVFVLGAAFGTRALGFFVLQTVWAHVLIAAVNYLVHWGLRREARKPAPIDAWDCDARLSHFSLFGLARHADHHVAASRPYHELRRYDESPKLPYGYVAMIALVLARNGATRRLLAAELGRRRLGPFAPLAGASESP